MASIDDIWDTPIVPNSPPRPEKTGGSDAPLSARYKPTINSTPLFLESDDDEEQDTGLPIPSKPPGTSNLGAMFAEVMDDDFNYEPLAPALDLDAIARRAAELHAPSQHAILPSSSPGRDAAQSGDAAMLKKPKEGADTKPARKEVMRLDESRLLSTTHGFPQLIETTKGYKPKGKGHEAEDLNRLLGLYQFWTHKLYPKTQFKDTVDRIEKLCHSKRMHVALSVWRDEAKGIVPGRKEDPVDLTSDAEKPDRPEFIDTARPEDETSVSRPPSSRSSLPPDDFLSNEDGFNEDSFDIGEIIKEEERRMQEEQRARSSTSNPVDNVVEDDVWMDLSTFDDPAPVSSLLSPKTMEKDREGSQGNVIDMNVQSHIGDLGESNKTPNDEETEVSAAVVYDGNADDMEDLYV